MPNKEKISKNWKNKCGMPEHIPLYSTWSATQRNAIEKSKHIGEFMKHTIYHHTMHVFITVFIDGDGKIQVGRPRPMTHTQYVIEYFGGIAEDDEEWAIVDEISQAKSSRPQVLHINIERWTRNSIYIIGCFGFVNVNILSNSRYQWINIWLQLMLWFVAIATETYNYVYAQLVNIWCLFVQWDADMHACFICRMSFEHFPNGAASPMNFPNNTVSHIGKGFCWWHYEQ